MNTAVEAANFAARLGLESLGLSLPLTFPFGEEPKHQRNFIYIGKREDLEKYGLTGFGDILKDEWNSGIFLLPSQKRIPDVLICGDEKGLEEILHYLSYLPTDSRGVRERILSGIKIFQDRLGDLISKEPSCGMSPPKKFVRDYTIPDEREEILKLLERGAKKTRSKPQSIKVEVLMARPEGVRRKFREDIKRLYKRLGLGKSKIHITVLNAYKPGLSWIKEVVLREIAQEEIYENSIHPYSEALFSAAPAVDPLTRRQSILLEGDVPSPINPPSGCRFHTRCPLRIDVCDQKEPPLPERPNGSMVACHVR